MTSQGCGVLLSFAFLSLTIGSWCLTENAFKLASAEVIGFSTHSNNDSPSNIEANGKTWAVLVAGSNGYMNYRHQADVCHAYQILKKGGLKDENIIVFMYDDIAFDKANPTPGVIINKPNGNNVYKGVPNDYTKDDVNADNFYSVILGNKSALNGGSGKVLNSGPNDHVFIYYSDHGAVGLLGMPSGSAVYANDLIDVLKKKHAAKGYKSMVFYVEACESGSIFEGLLPNDINIYATTAANAEENSYATYCPFQGPVSTPDYRTCLGDLYSISWMEDCDKQDLHKETLQMQYETVRRRTNASHVMQYGDMSHRQESVSTYMGADRAKGSYTSTEDTSSVSRIVSQRDVDLLHFQHKFQRAPTGSHEKLEAQKQLLDEIAHRKHVDYSINKIGEILFGYQKSSNLLMKVRSPGQPLVDDWDCFKMLVRTYENHCGPLSTYGRKYMRAIANICNAGVTIEKMVAALDQTCSKKPHV